MHYLKTAFNQTEDGAEEYVAFDEDEQDLQDALNVSSSKTTVIAAFVMVLAYFSSGVLFFMLREKNWSFIDALYFSAITVTTIGYGDFTPNSDGGRIFDIIFILTGIGMIGFALGVIGNFIVAQQEALLQKALEGKKEEKDSQSFFARHPAFVKLLRSVAILVIVILLGTLVYCLNEGKGFIDGFYWATQTCTTVGYGDMPVSKDSTKWFIVFYALVGCLATAVALGSFADAYIEHQQAQARDRILHQKLTMNRIADLDSDGDGKVSLQEFVEAMLVKLQKCEKSDIQELKDQFKVLDSDGSGFLDQEDLKKLTVNS